MTCFFSGLAKRWLRQAGFQIATSEEKAAAAEATAAAEEEEEEEEDNGTRHLPLRDSMRKKKRISLAASHRRGATAR